MRRFNNSYLKDGTGPHVDCFVRTDRYVRTLLGCLRDFERQGGSVKWASETIQQLLIAEAAELSPSPSAYPPPPPPHWRHVSKNQVVVDPRTSHHSPCAHYFDRQTASFVQGGPE